MTQALPVTLSIVSYHAPVAQLACAIRSVAEALVGLGADLESKIILVDNSESNELDLAHFEMLQPTLQQARCKLSLIKGHGNIGYGAAHNLAFQTAGDGYHIFMNPDVELEPDSLTAGLDYLATHPEVAMISPHATDAQGQKQHLCKRYPTVFDFFLRGFMPGFIRRPFDRRLARFEMRELSETEPTSGIPIISGCFMLCRSEVIARVSGFDTAYFLYFEDFDLSLRVAKLAPLAYVPAMRIKHEGGGSARKGLSHILMFCRSARRFFSSHGWRWYSQP